MMIKREYGGEYRFLAEKSRKVDQKRGHPLALTRDRLMGVPFFVPHH